jgi:hypothetical protein
MDETKLREKLNRIEALFAGATTEGERVAAGEARRRIQYLDEVTDRIIAEALHRDSSEAAEVAEPPKLGPGPVDVEG